MKHTKEQYTKLNEVIEAWRKKPGPLMPVLNEAQGIFGCLDEEIQEYISKELKIEKSKIYEVATFYSRFTLKPKGKYTIGICMGTACYVRGANFIMSAFEKELNIKNGGTTEDGLFTLEAVRCIGCCGLAPAIAVNEEVHGKITIENVGKILEEYKKREEV